MNDLLSLFIYIDEYLIKSLSSVYLNGFIDIRTSRRICDNTLAGRIHLDENNKIFCSDGKSRIYNKGFKTNNKSNDFNETTFYGNDRSVESRIFGRTEEEIKRIFTTFEIHNNMITRMINSNALKDINDIAFVNSNISEGDYIRIKGCITETSISSYLDSIISLLECFPIELLDSLLVDQNLGRLNFSIILNLLKSIKNKLSCTSTDDIIMNCSDYTAILNTNSKYFLNGDCYVYDKCNCNCNVLGKVIKVCTDGNDCINLLRKLTQENYYIELLNSISPYLDLLKNLDIPIPKYPEPKIKSPTVLIAPISMYF